MLSRRAELARLLGHPTWAAYATEDKMIGGEAQAAAFVERIADAAGARMRRDHADLLERKRRDDPGAERVDPWDSAFYAERIKAERFGADARAARPYLEYRAVRDGILELTGLLFGIAYRRVEVARRLAPRRRGLRRGRGGPRRWAASGSTCTRARASTSTSPSSPG